MSRLELSDSGKDVILKMSDGNPGAITFMIQLLSSGHPTDMMIIVTLDALGIYGSKAYMVWNDICDKNLETVRLMMMNLSFGKITKEHLLENLSQGRAVPYDLVPESELTV